MNDKEYGHIIKSLQLCIDSQVCIDSLSYQIAPRYTPESIEDARADLKANLQLAIDIIQEAGLSALV